MLPGLPFGGLGFQSLGDSLGFARFLAWLSTGHTLISGTDMTGTPKQPVC